MKKPQNRNISGNKITLVSSEGKIPDMEQTVNYNSKGKADRIKLQNTKQETQQLLNAILQAQEEERAKIAEALHSGLGQLLYATKLKIEDCKDNGKVKNDLLGFLNEAITETRNLSFLLMPALLKDLGLEVALKDAAKRFSTQTFRLNCVVSGLKARLEPDLEIALFRIIQELLNNVLKHSKAERASIIMRKKNQKIEIIVKDDGVGFDKKKNLYTNGTGLKSINNRLNLIDGTMSIESGKDAGTTILIRIKVV